MSLILKYTVIEYIYIDIFELHFKYFKSDFIFNLLIQAMPIKLIMKPARCLKYL